MHQQSQWQCLPGIAGLIVALLDRDCGCRAGLYGKRNLSRSEGVSDGGDEFARANARAERCVATGYPVRVRKHQATGPIARYRRSKARIGAAVVETERHI